MTHRSSSWPAVLAAAPDAVPRASAPAASPDARRTRTRRCSPRSRPTRAGARCSGTPCTVPSPRAGARLPTGGTSLQTQTEEESRRVRASRNVHEPVRGVLHGLDGSSVRRNVSVLRCRFHRIAARTFCPVVAVAGGAAASSCCAGDRLPSWRVARSEAERLAEDGRPARASCPSCRGSTRAAPP